MSYLVDTDVLSEPTKPLPNDKVVSWFELHEDDIFVSVITLGEIEKGIRLLPAGKNRRSHESRFAALCESLEGRVLPLTAEMMTTWAQMYASEQLKGRRLPGFDSLLAATALHHKLTMVTRNEKDFPKSLPLINPWKA